MVNTVEYSKNILCQKNDQNTVIILCCCKCCCQYMNFHRRKCEFFYFVQKVTSISCAVIINHSFVEKLENEIQIY